MSDYANLIEQARLVQHMQEALDPPFERTANLLRVLADAVEALTAERDEARKWANTMEHERDWERDVVQSDLIARAEAAEAARDRVIEANEENQRIAVKWLDERDRLAAALRKIEPLLDAQFVGHTNTVEFMQKAVALNDAVKIAREALAATEANR